MPNVHIPEWDYRDGGLLALARDRREEASAVMDAVLDGFGVAGAAIRPLLPLGDRVAARRLAAMGDPYLQEVLALPRLIGRPGPAAFSLSYEWGCTCRVFETGGVPLLLRVLDWPFRGLGERVEIVHLSGPAGSWITATWPGVLGALHGAAPRRFAAALNQAPERRTGLGRAVDYLSAKRRFLGSTGIAPAHLLRLVLETAPDYASARRMLSETPVAVPVIYTLAGTRSGESCVIERLETRAEEPSGGPAAAANHFASAIAPGDWRPRGIESASRRAAAQALGSPPALDALSPPILNALTRLALTADAAGRLSVVGYDGDRRVTRVREAQAV